MVHLLKTCVLACRLAAVPRAVRALQQRTKTQIPAPLLAWPLAFVLLWPVSDTPGVASRVSPAPKVPRLPHEWFPWSVPFLGPAPPVPTRRASAYIRVLGSKLANHAGRSRCQMARSVG